MWSLSKYPGVPWIWHKSPRLLYRSPNFLGKIEFWAFLSFHFIYTFSACMFCFPNSNHVMFPRKFAFCLHINYAYIGTWMHMHTGVGWHLNKEKVLWSTISWSEIWKRNNYKLFFFHYSFNHRTVSQALFHVFHHWHHLWSVLHVRLRVRFREVDVGGFCKRDRLHITVEPRYFEVPREMEKSLK